MTKALWTAIVAFVVSNVLYFGSKYFAPGVFEDVEFVVGAFQVLIAVIMVHFYGTSIARAFRAYSEKF